MQFCPVYSLSKRNQKWKSILEKLRNRFKDHPNVHWRISVNGNKDWHLQLWIQAKFQQICNCLLALVSFVIYVWQLIVCKHLANTVRLFDLLFFDYLNFYILSCCWLLIFIVTSIITLMARNGLLYADVLLRNYSLNDSVNKTCQADDADSWC